MNTYQQQAEQEMWDAASREHGPPRQYVYDVIAPTGARCLSTDDLQEARTRADITGGRVLDRFERCVYDPHAGRPRPDYDPRIDHPERYTDGPI